MIEHADTVNLKDPFKALRLLFPETSFSDEELKNLLPVAHIQEHETGVKIITEGQPNDNQVYFLLKGSVSVSIQDRFILRLSNQGDSIGEMGLITSSPRSATVTTDEPSVFLVVLADISQPPKTDTDYRLRYYFSRLFNTILTNKLRQTSERARMYEDMVTHTRKIEKEQVGLQNEISRYLREISLYTHLVDSAQDAIMVADTNGTILSVNPAFTQILGYPPEEMQGRDLSETLNMPAQGENTWIDLVKSSASGSWSEEVTLTTKKGRVLPADCSLSMVNDVHGGLLAYSVILRDISQRKAYEKKILSQSRALAQANEELQALDKDKNNFLHLASHHLRTPITSIMAYTELLTMEETINPDDASEFVPIIHTEAEKLAEMVNKLLAIAKMESGQMHFQFEPHELHIGLIGEISMLREKAEAKGLTLQLESPEEMETVICDLDQMKVAVKQVLENAINYTESGSIKVILSQNESHLMVKVSDTGKGIHGFDVNGLLDRFTREEGLDAHSYGLGLGLPLCYMIIKAHTGELSLLPNKGTGTTVSIRIPIKPPDAKQ